MKVDTARNSLSFAEEDRRPMRVGSNASPHEAIDSIGLTIESISEAIGISAECESRAPMTAIDTAPIHNRAGTDLRIRNLMFLTPCLPGRVQMRFLTRQGKRSLHSPGSPVQDADLRRISNYSGLITSDSGVRLAPDNPAELRSCLGRWFFRILRRCSLRDWKWQPAPP